MGLYYYSVGNGCNLLLNIGPDRRGLLPEKDKQAILAVGREVERRFSAPIDTQGLTVEGNEATVVLNDLTLVDHVVIEEDLQTGDPVSEFEIFVKPHKGWHGGIKVYCGKTIGHKRIVRIPAVSAEQVSVRFVSKEGKAKLKDVKLYYTK